MSDVCAESRKEPQNEKRVSGIDDLSHAVARIAVAQICERSGFQGFKQFALDILTDVAVRYIQDIGKTANLYSNLASRSECNVFDVIQGLEDLGSVQGFLGASDVHHCLSRSGMVREIIRYTGEAEEVPFAFPLPGFPVVKERTLNHSFVNKGESPPDEHIPSWLPSFPDPGTNTNMNVGDEKVVLETDEAGKHREADIALTNLQQPIACNGSKQAISINLGNSTKGKRTEGSNPFLVSPLQFGEKEVSSVILPDKLANEAFLQHLDHAVMDNHVSGVHISSPAIKAVKSSECNPEDGKKNIPVDMKPPIQFKFGGGKKSFIAASGSQLEDIEKIASWFDDDGGKDDKRRRVEQIVEKSIENNQELTHL